MKKFLLISIVLVSFLNQMKAEKWDYLSPITLYKSVEVQFSESGKIVFDNINGIDFFDGKKWNLELYKKSDSNFIAGQIFLDTKKDIVWRISKDYKYFKGFDLNEKTWNIFENKEITNISKIQIDKDGILWIWEAQKNMWNFDGAKLSIKELNMSDSLFRTMTYFNIDQNNNKFLSNFYNVFRIDAIDSTLINISSHPLRFMGTDKKGNLYYIYMGNKCLRYHQNIVDTIILPYVPIDKKLLFDENDNFVYRSGTDTVIITDLVNTKIYNTTNSYINSYEIALGANAKNEIWFWGDNGIGALSNSKGQLFETNTMGLRAQYCNTFVEIEDNKYAVGCFNFLTYEEGNKYSAEQISRDNNFRFLQIVKDNRGQIWHLANDGKIYFKEKLKWNTLKNQKEEIFAMKIIKGNDGNLWICSDAKLIIYDGLNLQYIKAPFHFSEQQYNNRDVLNFIEDSKGNKWISKENDGMYVYKNNEWKIYNFENTGHIEYGAGYYFTIDRFDNLWFVNNTRLVKYDGNEWTYYFFDGDSNFFENSNNITVDKENKIWVSSMNKGFISFDGENFKTYTKTNSPLFSNIALKVEIAPNNDKWFFMDFGIFIFNENNEAIIPIPISSESINMYPNPVLNNILIENLKENDQIIITDIMGRKVWNNNSYHEGLNNWNINSISSGIYIVNIFRENSIIFQQKLVKE